MLCREPAIEKPVRMLEFGGQSTCGLNYLATFRVDSINLGWFIWLLAVAFWINAYLKPLSDIQMSEAFVDGKSEKAPIVSNLSVGSLCLMERSQFTQFEKNLIMWRALLLAGWKWLMDIFDYIRSWFFIYSFWNSNPEECVPQCDSESIDRTTEKLLIRKRNRSIQSSYNPSSYNPYMQIPNKVCFWWAICTILPWHITFSLHIKRLKFASVAKKIFLGDEFVGLYIFRLI